MATKVEPKRVAGARLLRCYSTHSGCRRELLVRDTADSSNSTPAHRLRSWNTATDHSQGDVRILCLLCPYLEKRTPRSPCPTYPFLVQFLRPTFFRVSLTFMSIVFRYLRESLSELHQVRWPTQQQAIRLTVIVIGFILAMSLFFGVVDALIAALIKATI